MTGIFGALADAWAEIRVHKMRVLLSLVGIAVSVGALTAVVAISEYQMQMQIEQSDRYGGRAATVVVNTYRTDGFPIDLDAFAERFDRVAERYGFSHVARSAQGVEMQVQGPEGLMYVSGRLIDPEYGVIHREKIVEGREFRSSDIEALAPAVIISEPLWELLGSVPVSQNLTIRLGGEIAGVYQVVGVRPKQWAFDQTMQVEMLFDAYRTQVDRLSDSVWVSWHIWVPQDKVSEIGPVLAMDLRAGLGSAQSVEVRRSDWGAQQGMDDLMRMQELILGGIAALILALGALSLINIQLVAMRQRVREIGVRRAFGASGARVFTTVFLESLVATTVAGVIGIALTVAIMRWVLTSGLMFPELVDVPPFPLRAALTGLIAAVVVGAVSGFIPALVALRVKVIDAIRF